MRFSIYFERDPFEDHITPGQWFAAVESVAGVRLVTPESSGPECWIGDFANPLGSPGHHFHDRPDRAYDAEVHFRDTDEYCRAFYSHDSMENSTGGVIICDYRETNDITFQTDPVHLASIALARRPWRRHNRC